MAFGQNQRCQHYEINCTSFLTKIVPQEVNLYHLSSIFGNQKKISSELKPRIIDAYADFSVQYFCKPQMRSNQMIYLSPIRSFCQIANVIEGHFFRSEISDENQQIIYAETPTGIRVIWEQLKPKLNRKFVFNKIFSKFNALYHGL